MVGILGQRLKEVRGQMSQTAAAKGIGTNQQTLSRYEECERTPDAEMLKRIAEYYGVSCDYLLGISESKSPDPDAVNFYALTGLSDDVLLLLEKAKNDAADVAVLETILSSDNFAESVTAFANIKRINDGKKDFSPENYMQEIRAINAFERLRHEVIQKLTGRQYK